jgi:hypothetical protein
MSITLRHKKYPLIIVYRDPKENWDNIVKDKLLKEIEEKGFDSFVLEIEEKIEEKQTQEEEDE